MQKLWKGTPTAYKKNEYGVKRRLDVLFDAGFDPANQLILDLGAGACAYSRVMKDMHAQNIVSVDINRERLKHADSGLNRINCSASLLPFRQHCFDCALIIEVLEHVDDDKSCIAEANRVLKDDAYLFITVPNSFFILETHGIRLFSTEIENFLGLGIPFVSFFPQVLRKHIERARIFSVKTLTKLVNEFDLQIFSIDYMMPPLDKIERDEIRIKNVNMNLIAALRKILSKIERTPLRIFGAHIMIVARKIDFFQGRQVNLV